MTTHTSSTVRSFLFSRMLYKSTRGGEQGLSFESVLFSTYAKDGGLYVPEELPQITHDMLCRWRDFSFPQICAEILYLFTDIDISTLNDMTSRAYSCFNGGNDPLPMTKIYENIILLDASCGPTLAFKDVGQQIVAQLLSYYLAKSNRKAKIMVDTSGSSSQIGILTDLLLQEILDQLPLLLYNPALI